MYSMTGMGKARVKIGERYVTVEIKSVNHKYCEVNMRCVPRFQSFEIPVIKLVKSQVMRGKVDIWIGEERGDERITINKTALKKYHQFLKDINKELKLNDVINLGHIQNGAAMWSGRDIDSQKMWPHIRGVVNGALDDLISMRKQEGSNLQKNIETRVVHLVNLTDKVLAKKEVVFNVWQEKFKNRIEKILKGVEVDQSKLANEIAFHADRSDITEELDRLQSHYSQIKQLLKGVKPCGRPLDFLIQELYREWNTIASKCQNVNIAHWVVEAKTEIEKMREQVQNIE